MIKLKIDNKSVEVPEGTSVMEAAKAAGIHIPAMCMDEELDHFTSCMLCLVKDATGRMFPSCSVAASGGMRITTDDEEIREGRRIALELLLSEHVGDCEAPCQLGCPAHMNIPLMNRLIAGENGRKASGWLNAILHFLLFWEGSALPPAKGPAIAKPSMRQFPYAC